MYVATQGVLMGLQKTFIQFPYILAFLKTHAEREQHNITCLLLGEFFF